MMDSQSQEILLSQTKVLLILFFYFEHPETETEGSRNPYPSKYGVDTIPQLIIHDTDDPADRLNSARMNKMSSQRTGNKSSKDRKDDAGLSPYTPITDKSGITMYQNNSVSPGNQFNERFKNGINRVNDNTDDSNFFSFTHTGEGQKNPKGQNQTLDGTLDSNRMSKDSIKEEEQAHEKQIRILQEQLEFTKQLVKAQTDKSTTLTDYNSKLEYRYFLISTELLRLNNDLEDKKSKLEQTSQLERALEELKKQNHELNSQIDQTSKQARNTENQYKRTSTEAEDLREEIRIKNEQIERRNEQIEEMKKELFVQQQEIQEMRGKLEREKLNSDKSMVEKLRDFEDALAELKDNNDFLQTELEKERIDKEKEPKQIMQFKEDNVKLKKQLVEIAKERDEAYDRLMTEHTKTRENLDKERKKAKIASQEQERTKQYIQELQNSIKDVSLQCAMLRQTNAQLEHNLAECKQNLTSRDEYKKRLEEVLVELEKFKREQQDIEIENNERIQEAEELLSERNHLADKLNDYSGEIQRLQADNESLMSEIHQLTEMLDDMQNRNIDFSSIEGHRIHQKENSTVRQFLMALEIHRLNKIVQSINQDNQKLMDMLNNENNRGLANSSYAGSYRSTYRENQINQSKQGTTDRSGFNTNQSGTFKESKILTQILPTTSDRGIYSEESIQQKQRVQGYVKTIEELENKVKMLQDLRDETNWTGEGSSKRNLDSLAGRQTGSDDSRVRDLEMKLKILRLENSKLDEALVGKIKEMEGLKNQRSSPRPSALRNPHQVQIN